MVSYAVKADLLAELSCVLERAGLVEDVADLARVGAALSNCPPCRCYDLENCANLDLDQELRWKHKVDSLLSGLPFFGFSVGAGGDVAPRCRTHERLLQDKVGIQIKLLLKYGLADRPDDCVDVFI